MALSGGVDEEAVLLPYPHREVPAADLEFLRQQCAAPWATRGDLTRAICQTWNWRQANGSFSSYACSDLLLRLEERGLLTLPTPPPLPRQPGRKAFSPLPFPPHL